jgi:hypothetical protein
MVAVAFNPTVVVLPAAVRRTVPVPVPLVGESVIHGAAEAAVQVQVGKLVVTVTRLVPPLPGNATDKGETV